jgi:putative peptidoglycan lipid II flippase
MGSIFLSRVIGLIRDAIVSAQFGQNDMTDAYVAAFRIPDLIFYLVAGGALSSAFIPVFSEKIAKGLDDEAWDIFSAVACIMLAVVSTLVILAMIFAPELTRLIAGGKDPELFAHIAMMGRILLPAQICFFLGSLIFAALYSKGEYTVPGLGPNLYNIGIIFGAIVISQFVTPGVAGMCWGALIGAFVGNILVPIWALPRVGVKFKASFNYRNPGVQQVFKLMLPVILGLSLPSVFMIILTRFGSYFADGVNTAIENANKIQMAPLGVFGMSLALAVFPKLSQTWALGDKGAFKDLLVGTLNSTTYLAIPSAAVMIAVPDQVIRLLLERGAFTVESTLRTAPILQAFAVGLLFWCLQPVLMRAYYSTQDTKTPVIMGTICTAIFVLLCWLVMVLGLPYPYLALAGSATALVLVVMMMATLSSRLDGLDLRLILGPFAKCAAASLLLAGTMMGTFFAFTSAGSPGGGLGQAAAFFFSFLVGSWLYYGATKLMGMKEANVVERAMGRLTKGKSNAG